MKSQRGSWKEWSSFVRRLVWPLKVEKWSCFLFLLRWNLEANRVRREQSVEESMGDEVDRDRLFSDGASC